MKQGTNRNFETGETGVWNWPHQVRIAPPRAGDTISLSLSCLVSKTKNYSVLPYKIMEKVK